MSATLRTMFEGNFELVSDRFRGQRIVSDGFAAVLIKEGQREAGQERRVWAAVGTIQYEGETVLFTPSVHSQEQSESRQFRWRVEGTEDQIKETLIGDDGSIGQTWTWKRCSRPE